MSLAAIVGGIVAIAKAIPAVERLVSLLVEEWTKIEIEKWNEERRQALRKLLDEQDQRDLERVIGNPKAGKPSGDSGAVVLPGKPPGVH